MTHEYTVEVTWTGNTGAGTSTYRAYSRDHHIRVSDKDTQIEGSSDPRYRGNGARYNPEELLVASLSACHMLWYLHLCADAGIVVTAYRDAATGTMRLEPDGSGHFTNVTLHPRVTLANPNDRERADDLHQKAHAMCFIARSVDFTVECRPRSEP